jgi:hypothetical protein
VWEAGHLADAWLQAGSRCSCPVFSGIMGMRLAESARGRLVGRPLVTRLGRGRQAEGLTLLCLD